MIACFRPADFHRLRVLDAEHSFGGDGRLLRLGLQAYALGIAYEFAHATRTIFMDGTAHMEDLDFWMGDGRGRWEGDTLVIDTVSLGDQTWFDEAGNFHSDALHVVERLTPTDATHIDYNVTLEDPKVFTRPWKINMTLYRRVEKNLELLDYECSEHVYEKLFKQRAGKP